MQGPRFSGTPNVCAQRVQLHKGGGAELSCGVLSGSFGFLKACRHCRAGFSFHGRSEIQAGRAALLFVIVNLSLYLIATFPQHSKSGNRTEEYCIGRKHYTAYINCYTFYLGAFALSFLLRK